MIPKILHIIWVGDDNRRPDQLIQTWVQHHPDWEVRVWGNDDLVSLDWRCRRKLFELGQKDCAAVADAMRWEILLADGGVCVAADSVCLRPLDEDLLELEAFACWESELGAPGIVSSGYFGCEAGNPLVARIVETIANTDDIAALPTSAAVGSELLTRVWREMKYGALTVLPSYTFIPRHPRSVGYNGGGRSYACELWASTLGILDELPGIAAQAVSDRLAQSQATAALASAVEQPDAPAADADPAQPPLFSIVIPTYNRAATIAEALGSALAQDGEDFEVLVIDDGSTDSTPALLQRLVEAGHQPGSAGMDETTREALRSKLRVVRQANAGAAAARNRGVQEARGEYIVWLDSDDLLTPDTLTLHRLCLAKGHAPDVMYGDLTTTDPQGRTTGRLDYPDYAVQPLLPDLLVHNRVPNPGTAVRRALYGIVGGYDGELPASEDYDFWLRAAAQGATFRHVGGIVCRYRIHPGGRSASAARNNTADAQILLKAMRSGPLERLFPTLDWSQPLVARTHAFTIATQLFVSRGCWREAAELAAGVQLCASALCGEEVLPQTGLVPEGVQDGRQGELGSGDGQGGPGGMTVITRLRDDLTAASARAAEMARGDAAGSGDTAGRTRAQTRVAATA